MGINTKDKKKQAMATSEKRAAKTEQYAEQKHLDGVAEDKKNAARFDYKAELKKVLDRFHPTALEWIKENFCDISELSSFSRTFFRKGEGGSQTVDTYSKMKEHIAQLYELSRSGYAGPFEVVLHPLVYDAEKKEKNKEMPAIKQNLYLRVYQPTEKGKPVAIDKEKGMIFKTLAVIPFIDSEVEKVERVDEVRTRIPFTESQMQALEGIGANRSRFYSGFNSFPDSVKTDMVEGRVFDIVGSVTTKAGLVNVAGKGRLITDDKGNAEARFEPYDFVERGEGQMVDIERCAVNGTLKVDFFEKKADGVTDKTDVMGRPILRKEAQNLLEFGHSMGPLPAKIYKREGIKETTTDVDVIAVAVGSNVCYKVLDRNYDLTLSNGETVRTSVDREAVRAVKDGNVFVDNRIGSFPFKTVEDERMYQEGKAAVVVGVKYKNKEGVLTYDAVIVPSENGRGKAFSPESSKRILASRAEAKGKSVETAEKPKKKTIKRFGQGL